MEKVNNYVGLNNKYLREADTLVRQGDYVQASEKFWGAAAEMVKAVAVKRGIELRSSQRTLPICHQAQPGTK